MLYLLQQVNLSTRVTCLYFISHLMLCRLYLFFSDSGMRSSKVCSPQVANGSDYKIGFFDMLSNTRLKFHAIHLHVKLMASTPDTVEGRLIITDIIPAIVKLRSQYNIKFTTMFSYHILLEHGNHPLYITSADITSSDKFFESIAFK